MACPTAGVRLGIVALALAAFLGACSDEKKPVADESSRHRVAFWLAAARSNVRRFSRQRATTLTAPQQLIKNS